MCCEKEKKCERPQDLKGKPTDCSPEQVRKCHGDDKNHPCTSEEDK